jgi:transcriptional regulator with XRE-family HTH domain
MTGKELKARLKEIGLTQKAMAELCGITEHGVSKWARGKAPVPGYAVTIIELKESLLGSR